MTKDVSPVNASSAAGGITTQLLDIHDDQINLTDTHLPHHISKRALTWYDAVCKGRQLWLGKIHRAFDGVSTGARDYGENDINNGWTKLDIFRPFPDGFVEAFEMIGKDVYPDLGEREPTFTEFKGINLEQGKRYIDGAGKPRDVSQLPYCITHFCLTPQLADQSKPISTGNPTERQPHRALRMLLHPPVARHHLL